MLTGLKESSLVRKCVFYRLEYTGKWGSHGTEIKFLKFKFEIYQRIKLKEQMRKMGSFVQLSLLPELWLLNVKNSSFYLLSAGYNKKSVPVWVRNLSASERFCLLRKYYGFHTSQLPLAKFQRLKKQNFGIPLFTQRFF